MNGQWIGTYSGTNNGTIVADLDATPTTYSGVVFAYDANNAVPRSFGFVDIPKSQSSFSLRVPLQHQERGAPIPITGQEITKKFPDVQIPTYADTEWRISPDKINLSRKTEIGTNGVGEMAKSKSHLPSDLVPMPQVKSWADFKSFVFTLEPWRYSFRGHADNTWRLRTSFHRTGRASLMKFMTQDVPALHRHLSGLTAHHFNLNDPLDYAAFLNLVQHHGYPTPMLDWTQSPFVAAYFAFRDLERERASTGKKARILIFDSREWQAKHERALLLMPAFLHLTVLEPLATNNPRLVPQQSVSTVTNIDDLEKYLGDFGQRENTIYLAAIDLPANERQTVMHELALMGITAGSLFPGLDGACRQLRERLFDSSY